MRRLALGLLLCAAPAAATPVLGAAAGAGIWFGIGQSYDKGGMYIDNMMPDGRIVTQFRSCTQGKGEDHIQSGAWSIKDGVLTIAVSDFDGAPAPRTDHYRVQSITERSFDYNMLPTGFPFRARRVGADFRMPSCDMVS